ncbi:MULTISPECIES: RNA-binding S4 domain-containing protein [Luteibacter]|uniref:RNA-binding S4 domain-containing protein n=1 Tax=Luteibacter flocculans TaxID=2780091 RepID=A0ABY4T4P8_9GAMM|nr:MULTISPECIES: RNA-binding S4 domain-containing protein [Luteibacter]URL59883.1 RNA-binding S4 domain-containing protein [Luteibacter flocculans]SFW19082.1 ribosome-associated protein [Luteibacter sp. UNCMF366Tsu5.1]
MSFHEFRLQGDYVELNLLLKLVGIASSGGEGKHMVADGRVAVDGVTELRKTYKVRAGQVVTIDDEEISVLPEVD